MPFSLRSSSRWVRPCVALALISGALGPVRAQPAATPSTAPAAPVAPRTGRVDHSVFDRLLRTAVVNGQVDYAAFARAPEFPRYLALLDRASVDSLNEDERLAFWLNVYNAYTIQLIVSHRETESIRNVNKTLGLLRLKGPWSEPLVKAAGRTLTLDEVEHRIIRKDFHDARVHFALVSAAIGSPPLRSEAYTGAALNDQLWDQGVKFLGDTTKNSFAKFTMRLSPIFTYYRTDFATTRAELGEFLAPWFSGEAQKQLASGRFGTRETTFDWALNGPPVKPKANPTVRP